MKIFKKSIATVLAVLMVLSCICCVAFAADDEIMVFVRVEGIKKNLCNDIIYVSEGATVYDALCETGLDIGASESQYGTYVYSIEGEAAATFGGWDGWLYEVNGEESSVSMSNYTVSDCDGIIIYYGDPYGVGFQKPEVNSDNIADGYLTITSEDTVYDDDWNATIKTMPVAGATVTFDGTKLTSDDNGKVTIPSELLTTGSHSVQVEKYAENGCPLVLRLPADYTVSVAGQSQNFFRQILSTIRNFFQKIIDFFRNLFN